LRFTSLSSGSGGNALVVESGAASGRDPTRLMVDCGLALKDIIQRLDWRGLALSDLDAIFVTHEHQDHVGGVARLARAANIPVMASHGTRAACPQDFWSGVQVIEIDSHASFEFCDLHLRCFPVPHDAREPTQLVIESLGAAKSTGGASPKKLGVLTDCGRSTAHIESMLSACDALFLEANHDAAMLAQSDYPEKLKSRIGGDYGHLSNLASAQMLSAIDQSRLQHLVAAHLSRHNNTPELVRDALTPVMARHAQLYVASQDEGFDWVQID
jgi:phosphoribosyl 1,2-cyclic phosphodiesterase